MLSELHGLVVHSVLYLERSMAAEQRLAQRHRVAEQIEDELARFREGLLNLLCAMDTIHNLRSFR